VRSLTAGSRTLAPKEGLKTMESAHRLSPVRPSLSLLLALFVALAGISPAGAAATTPPEHPEYDDCEAEFLAFVGSDVYQFSPALSGDLATVHLFSLLSYQGAAAAGDFGRAFWRLEVRGPVAGPGSQAPLVRTARGVARIDADGQAKVDVPWDGRDAKGRIVAPGHYQYTFRARFLPDREGRRAAARYEDLAGDTGAMEARTSAREVIVNDRLDARSATEQRAAALLAVCQKQRNTPIEAGFPYNFYYGSTHSHSNWSDGGQPTTNCSSGNAYGSGTFDPAAIYDYAKNTAGLDYWVINEHNHLLNDAMATNAPPVTEVKIRQRYQSGLAAAAAATVNDSFIAVYGMEWGVLTNADQGHVTLLETPTLFGWETCTNCNGPNPECTAGTNCYFDVFTPKRFGYLTLYQRSVEHPSPQGPLGILCHPSTGQFDNFAFNANADATLQGIAVRSGVAFNTATNCATANIASVDYVPLWQDALNRGFHVGPTADHDAHCNTYGVGMPDRTVYLLPNGTTPVLTKAALLSAHKARHFFASEDANAQLVFATGDGAHIMGDIFNAASPLTLRAAAYDPDGETISTLEVWRGQIGAGIPTAPYKTVSGQSTLSFTESLTSGTFYYYVHAVQADGNDLWSAPMWVNYGGGCTNCSVDVSGWKLQQQNSAQSFTLPANTTIPSKGYLIVARSATKSAFETFWRGGTPLPSNVVYVNSGGALPQINGDENYTLQNAAGATVDGPTINMPTSANSTVQRKDPCLAAGTASSWTITTISGTTGPTPGSGAGTGCGKGAVINEFSDAIGTGNFVYEFVEIYNDK
jgi:hypothetical protein